MSDLDKISLHNARKAATQAYDDPPVFERNFQRLRNRHSPRFRLK